MTVSSSHESADTPIGRFLEHCLAHTKGKIQRTPTGWTMRCPAHDDQSPSLSVSRGNDGRVLLHCHAGCTAESIVDALGIEMSSLFAARPNRAASASANTNTSTFNGARASRPKLTLAALAEQRGLPLVFLRSLGWIEDYGAVCIPYPQSDGTIFRTRLRRSLIAKEGTSWGPGEGQIAFTPDGGALARAERYLIVCEGETDTVTLLYQGFPALGVPGAPNTKLIEAHHLEDVDRVYVVHEPDEAGDKFVPDVRARVAALAAASELGELGVYELRMPDGHKDPSALYMHDREGFRGALAGALKGAAKAETETRPPPHVLDTVWKTLGDWGSLRSAPPPRQWLLTRPDDETNGMANPIGVLAMSKVGLLIGAGGAGKTMIEIGLALAVATGRKWLDYFSVPNPGRVLIALGEEDPEEFWRRCYAIARAMRLTPEQEQQAADNIVALPLAGMPVALVQTDGRETVETGTMEALRLRLMMHEWRLIILDPLSRFAGADTEKDNAAATRFIQAAETLIATPGSPAVLISHHTNKLSRADGSKASASNARGASGLTDGGRWVAELESLDGDRARLTVTKSNYSRLGAGLELVRDGDHGGYLRVATPEERRCTAESRARGTERLEHEKFAALKDRICAELERSPDMSKATLASAVRARPADVGVAVDQLVKEQRIRKVSTWGFSLVQTDGGVL